jgi:tetratricopeptide (TPR) repeat protein
MSFKFYASAVALAAALSLGGAAFAQTAQLRERAFTAALYAGDVEAAARLAPAPNPDAPGLESMGRLTQAANALAENRGAEAVERLGSIEFPHRTAAALLRPWAQAAAGDWASALAVPDGEGDRIADLFSALARAELLEIKKRPDEAEAIYKALAEDQVASALFIPMYGEFLERRGRRADAVALYTKALAETPDDLTMVALKDRARRHGKPPRLPTLTEGAAQSMGFAAAAMNAQRQTELSLIYLRLALRLDPGLYQAWMLVGDALVRVEDETSARAAWGRVPPSSIYFAESRTKIIYSLQADHRADEALKLAEEDAHARPDDERAQLTYADMLRTTKRDPEAVAVLDRMIKAQDADWRPRYMRAISLDRLNRWPEAEADLNRAMALSADQPEVLNYLGYAWIDRGVKVREGMALVERAAAGQPQSGAIQDSLAWAHYKLGDYAQAVSLLESAVMLAPADPAVNDHLGDAYWMVGRKDEARFQWRRVLSLDPNADQKAAAEKKLAEGLPAARAQPAAVPTT